MNMEEVLCQVVEEDKRRRNIVVSVCFCVKKKQCEQVFEKFVKEMFDKVFVFESKVFQFEIENKWFKNFFVDKNEGNEEIVIMWKEFIKYVGEWIKKVILVKDEW